MNEHEGFRDRHAVSTLTHLAHTMAHAVPLDITQGLDRTLALASATHTDFTGETYHQAAYNTRCSTQLLPVETSYRHALSLLPEDLRMSALDEIAYLVTRAGELAREGRSPREALCDPLLATLINPRPTRWELTHAALRAPRGEPDFRKYVERDSHGRTYYRADYLIGDCLLAEGVLIPQGLSRPVVEWNTALRIPALTSNGHEPNHLAHFYFDDSSQENQLLLWGFRQADEEYPCINVVALYRRSAPLTYTVLRLFDSPLLNLA